MADISAEITAFRNAVYGEDVRSAMISLANKLNVEVINASSIATEYSDLLDKNYESVFEVLKNDNYLNEPLVIRLKSTKGYYDSYDGSFKNANTYVSTLYNIPITVDDTLYWKKNKHISSILVYYYNSQDEYLGYRSSNNENVNFKSTYTDTSYCKMSFQIVSDYLSLSPNKILLPYVTINRIISNKEYIENHSNRITTLYNSLSVTDEFFAYAEDVGFYSGSLVYSNNSDWKNILVHDVIPGTIITYTGWGSAGAPGILMLSGSSLSDAQVISTHANKSSDGGETSYSGWVFTNYEISIPSNATMVLVQTNKSIGPQNPKALITCLGFNNKKTINVKRNGDDIIYGYGESLSKMHFIFGKRGPNNLPDFKSINMGLNNVYSGGTDWIGPFVVRAKNNIDGDDLNHSTFTGGNHNYNNDGTSNYSATARNLSLHYYADGNELVDGDSYTCESIDIVLTNAVQATNTKKQDGSGREVLEERHRFHITCDETVRYSEIIPYEDVTLDFYYCFQAGGITNYGSNVRFVGGSNRVSQTISQSPNSGTGVANLAIITTGNRFNTKRFEMEIDTSVDCGRGTFVSNTDPTLFISNNKLYSNIIRSTDLNADEIYAARCIYRWFNEQ